MKVYVAMVIGCLECSNPSACLGAFDTREKARAAITASEYAEAFTADPDEVSDSFQARVFEVDLLREGMGE